MKNGLLTLIKNVVAPVALVSAMAAFGPVTAMAQNRGGHSYAAPSRGNSNGGRSFSQRGIDRGFPSNVNRGNAYGGRGEFRGNRDFRGGYYGGRGYGPGFGFGVGVFPSYGYAAPVCNPAGFYDQYGVWHFYPGCAAPYPY
jgi:hypothetical protein